MRYALLFILVTLGTVARAGGAGTEVPILSESDSWRVHFHMATPLIRRDGKLTVAKTLRLICKSPAAPAGWEKQSFDDSSWPRYRPAAAQRPGAEYGYVCSRAPRPGVRTMSLRGRFQLEKPSASGELTLSMSFRGGTVVYLNGKEVARAHLAGASAPNGSQLAEDYPPEAFVKTRGRPIRWGFGDPKKYKAHLQKRIRHLKGIKLPGSALKKGVNVLAVRIAGAPYYSSAAASGFNDRHYSLWGSCGLVKLKLSSAGRTPSGTVRSPRAKVWNHPASQVLYPSDRASSSDKLAAVRLAGTRNGTFSGQVVVESTGPVNSLKAVAGELKRRGNGKVIPASAVRVRYALPDGPHHPRKPAWYYSLEPKVLATGNTQPVWITVSVPPDAAPGEYRGSVELNLAGRGVANVPVELSVADWKLPPAQEFTGFVDLIQSPASVALQYKVKPWSKEHWKLVERSFELMGQVGAKVVYITVLPGTYFGNSHGMVRWIKKNGSYQHDFSIVDRYLDLATKHLGKPPVVCIYLWDRRTGTINYDGKDMGKGKGTPYSLLDPASGKITEAEGPRWGTPEARSFWKPVIAGLRARLSKRGLEKSMMWGMASDRRPRKETVGDLRALAPEVPWTCHSHPSAAKIHGQPVGYIAHVWGATPLYFCPPSKRRGLGWKREVLLTTFPRMSSGGAGTLCAQPLQKYRFAPEAIMASGYRGLGRIGGDFWNVIVDKRGRKSPVLRMTPDVGETWGIGLECAVQQMLGAGRSGPVSTTRLEAFRESLQETEARVFIEKALNDPAKKARLGTALATRCQTVLDERTWDMLSASQSPQYLCWVQNATARSKRLYAAAAEVSARLGK